MKRYLILISISIFLGSCTKNEKNEINIYSKRHYEVDKLLYKKFEEKTGIKVNIVKAGDDELLERLKNEGLNSPADLYVTVDAGKLQKGVEMELFQKIINDKIDANVRSELKDPHKYWIPITYRARLIVYSKDRVSLDQLSTYEDLANPKWKGRILVRSSSNAYNQALMSAMYANLGKDDVTKWSKGLVNNFARNPKGNDRDQVKAIAAGQGDLAIVNSYYIGLLLSSEKLAEIDAGNSVSIFFPNQAEGDRGTHINISGYAMTKNPPNKENAIKLLEYLTGEEAQNIYVNNSYEYPANPLVNPSDIVSSWGDFKIDNLDLNLLGSFRDDAIKVFDKTGWK
ncbi:MAG: Fe(3+) ABC transporter substrate-binding protein [Bacteroidetes bacterium MED-G13]|nr:Fe(3+) ABC transporter substrate-binding protein [Flavobacteriaceae bacterium]PDH47981.1 MAG: Fe(3+) ABC transporter substrate-binding protein [Bacteroidetes bacterium MED-G13]|tara:strand:+ start:43521 stop:44543 length:1023 start_codon:yes stop_codon:yes gene_type:complete